MPIQRKCDLLAMCLRACSFSKFVTVWSLTVNPYDDQRVFLLWLHGKGDLDMVWASLTHRKANVTEALDRLEINPRRFYNLPNSVFSRLSSEMGCVVRKPVFWASEKAILEPVSSATENS